MAPNESTVVRVAGISKRKRDEIASKNVLHDNRSQIRRVRYRYKFNESDGNFPPPFEVVVSKDTTSMLLRVPIR
jgi:hypothetical protein